MPAMTGRVVVDDLVDDRVRDRGRSAGDQVGPGLDPAADVAQRAGLAVADDDDEAVTDEHVDLAHLDLLGLVDVAGGLEHDEHRLVVDLELGTLVGVQRVLDGELVELELAPDGVELFVGRLVETEPDEGVLALAGCGHVGEGELTGLALPSLVQRAIDDHRGVVAPATTLPTSIARAQLAAAPEPRSITIPTTSIHSTNRTSGMKNRPPTSTITPTI